MFKLPYKVTNYYEYYKDNYFYCDKTKLIKFITDSKNKSLWFLRASGVGKSVNLSMLYYFFDIQENFITRPGSFLAKCPELERYKNRYPVIHLDFTDTESISFQDTLYNFKKTIRCVYNNYPFIFADKNDSLSYRIFNQKIYDLEASDEDYLISIKLLIDKISKNYGTQVIIIIDGYDDLFLKSIERNYYSELKSYFLKFLKESFINDENIFKIIISGIYKITDKPIFNSTLYNQFPFDKDFFFFTQTESYNFCYNISNMRDYQTYGNQTCGPFYLDLKLVPGHLLVDSMLDSKFIEFEKNILLSIIKNSSDKSIIESISSILEGQKIILPDHYHILTYDEINNLNKNNYLTALINYGLLGIEKIEESTYALIPNQQTGKLLKKLLEVS